MINLTIKHFASIFALLTISVSAIPAASGRAGVDCGKCLYDRNFLYGGADMVFKSNPGKCDRFVPGWGWGPGDCRNDNCDLCRFFK
jgi:hypothetical protein